MHNQVSINYSMLCSRSEAIQFLPTNITYDMVLLRNTLANNIEKNYSHYN